MADVPTRIIFAPFMHHDGQVDVREELIHEPEKVEIDGPWVHVVQFDSFGNRQALVSWPAYEVQRIEWVER